MTSYFQALLLACAVAAMGSAAAAPVLEINAGLLTGARGVTVEGETYDVKFLEGTCAAVHGSCANDAFIFTSRTQALHASQALLDQVFVDGPLGAFDADLNLTTGCSGRASCLLFTASMVPRGEWIEAGAIYNLAAPAPSGYNILSWYFLRLDMDTATSDNTIWAVWSKAAAEVPEPGSVALFGLTLAAMGTRLRRRRKA